MSNIKNLADIPATIGGTTIPPGKTANFHRWHVLQHSDSARSLLSAKLIEVVDDEEPKAKSKKKGGTDGVSGTDIRDV